MRELIVGVLLICSFLVSCGTVNVERNKINEIQRQNRDRGRYVRANYILPEDIDQEQFNRSAGDVNVIIQREEVFIPVDSQTQRPLTPAQSAQRAQAGAMATPANVVGGTQFYDYDEHRQFPIVTRPLALTTILLESGEIPIGVPYMSDTMRWEMTGDVWRTTDGRDIQMIMIKPLEVGLSTNMIVATNRRIYQFVLTSTRDNYMPMVRFRYPMDGIGRFITASNPIGERHNTTNFSNFARNERGEPVGEFLSFNYRIKGGWWLIGAFKPEWMPIEAWDNGRQTFIRLPRGVLFRDFPVVFEERNYIVNYRIEDNVMILDKLIRKATLRLDGKRVIVEKRRGQPEDVRRFVRQDVNVVGDMPPLNNSVIFDIRGDIEWKPLRVMEYDGETHIFFDDNVFAVDAVIQIIDENRNSVQYRRVGNVITIPRVIRTIQIAYNNQILTIQRRS